MECKWNTLNMILDPYDYLFQGERICGNKLKKNKNSGQWFSMLIFPEPKEAEAGVSL